MNTRISNIIFMFFVGWMYLNGFFAVLVISGLDITSIFYPSVLGNIIGFVLFMSIPYHEEKNEVPKMRNPPPPPCSNSVEIPSFNRPFYDMFDYDASVKESNE